jgi:Na+/H+-dicarboxylate symporter
LAREPTWAYSWPPCRTLGQDATGGAWYEGIIPVNPVRAAADVSVAPLVVFSLFLGFAFRRLPVSLAGTLLAPIEVLVYAVPVIVGWVLRLGPLGIAALATLLAYTWVLLGSGVPVTRFARAALPAQAIALGTQSSLASLPAMVETASALQVSHRTAKVVLPLAVSLFRAASVAANVAVAVYLSHLHEAPQGPGA